MNHLGDANKMVGDTPRTDNAEYFIDCDRGITCSGLSRQLERELNAANDRIKRLEDRIHRASMAFFRDGSDASVASGMLSILEEERGKK
jgi:hypothetical protein